MSDGFVSRRRVLSAVGIGGASLAGVGGYQTYTDLIENDSPDPRRVPQVIGHRGAADLEPENTIRSITRAEQEGADGVEIDIRESRDGVLVVMHDPVLDRLTTGTGLVENTLYKDIKQARVNGTEPIPTLDEALDVISDTSLSLFIEVKADDVTQRIMDTVVEYGLDDRTTIISFDTTRINTARDADWPCGLLGWFPINQLAEEAIDGEYTYVMPHFVPLQISSFIEQTWPTTVQPGVWSLTASEDEIRESVKAGPAMVMTNRPDIAVEIRDEVYDAPSKN